jgi:transcriptional regulator with GAF, ATPase, and Fis domain/pSer/pThr/pTyr-binding forkhead associated (FHA) protein
VFSLAPGDFIIGRDEAADLHLPDEYVSLRHCIVSVGPDRYFIHDCGSLNGTRLNGKRITGSHELHHGCQIEIGASELIFLEESDTAIPESTVELDASPVDPRSVELSMDGNPRLLTHQSMLELLRELRLVPRKSLSIRQKLLQFLLAKIPAERAAMLLMDSTGTVDSLSVDRKYPLRPVRLSKAAMERVYRDGIAIMTASTIYIPLTGSDGNLGVIYVATADRNVPFDADHFELMTMIVGLGGFALEQAMRLERMETENSSLKRDMEMRTEVLGESDAILKLRAQVARVAATDSTVLIQGETGTGKELIARSVHQNSRRSAGPFVAINCGAITESLLESELFGHEKGAFTGAVMQKKGKFELASGGTLFLDEVGELPTSLQVKLLRVLQEREIERLGGTKTIKLNVRLIAATNRDLEAEVTRDAFRRDLLYRLKVVTIVPPPLRECGDDIIRLARHFVAQYSREMVRHVRGISPEAEQMLTSYDWPGNVRQLQNFMDRAVVFSKTDMVLPEDLPEEFTQSRRSFTPDSFDLKAVADAAQRDLILKALRQSNGNWKEAAKLLGLNRTDIYRVAKRLGILLSADPQNSSET